jgi:hypothetical protein
MSVPLTDEELSGLYGSLRLLLHDQRSGIIRSLPGDADFDLGLIPDGMRDGGIQRAPILSAIDGLWDAAWRTRTVSKLAGSLAAYAGLAVVNAKILKHGFKFENGGLVPVNAAGEIPN